MLSVIDLELDSEVPIVSCELTPKMRVSLMSNTVSTAHVLNSATIEGQFLRYTWYKVSRGDGYCQPWARTWTYRRHNLLQEIVGYNADVVCLQEVHNSHLDDFLAPELIRLGYDFRYQRRTDKLDGCATFFKQNRFSFVKEYCIGFDKIAQDFVNVDPLASERLIQNNIALIVVLEFVDPSGKRQLICVANTRLEVKQDLKDVMLWHVHTLLKGMAAIANSSNGIPMIMCGDFNMIPESAPHLLVIMGKVDPSHQDLKIDPYGILQPLAELAHDLPLVSAYSAFWILQLDAMFAKHKMRVNSSSN